MERKNFICVYGRSGCGKTTITEAVIEKLVKEGRTDVETVRSYCDREPRYANEPGHIFVKPQDFPKDDCVAYNIYNGHQYGATKQQIEQCSLYVVDMPGIIDLKRNYKGSKNIICIGLKVSAKEAERRMRLRGDPEEKIKARLMYDEMAFEGMEKLADILLDVENLPVDTSVDIISSLI